MAAVARRTVVRVAGAVGVAGAAGVAAGIALDPDRALAGYLAAWAATATLAFGGLAFLAIGYAVNGRWYAVVRRPCEAIAGALVPVALLGIPLFVYAARVWPWAADPAGLPNRAFLSQPFFTIRSAIYFGVAIAVAEALRVRGSRTVASGSLPLLGFVGTFAAIDWLMSLQPAWWSSGFGLYVIVGGIGAAIALVVVITWRSAIPARPPHYHALGRLLHAFVILWAYLAYFQAMLIQIANKPREITFYLARWEHGAWIATALVTALCFAIPFVLLFPRALKRRGGALSGVALLVLVGHYAEAWWLVLPRGGDVPLPSWMDAAAVCAVGGLATAVAAWRMRGLPALPERDPYLAAGLAYEAAP